MTGHFIFSAFELLARLKEKRLVLKDPLGVKDSITPQNQVEFYSSWIYAAVHVALTIQKLQTKESLANYFKLEISQISEILDFMESLGLVQQSGGIFKTGQSRMHLGTDSPMLSKHHINWRLQAIQSLEKRNRTADLHYLSVVSISSDDVIRIKSILVKAIEDFKRVIRDSPEEELHSFLSRLF